MTTLILETPFSSLRWPAWREHGLALGVAVGLHLGLGWVLLGLSHSAPLAPVVTPVMLTQLVSLPAPVPAPLVSAPPQVEPEPLSPQVVAPDPVVQAPPVDEAALARKRVAQARREQQRVETQQRQHAERAQREQKVREAQARDASLEQERLAQAQAAEQARRAADARARAEAQAASRQYLPIAKEAPEYPQRALDRNIEGECTVAYTVSVEGRVTDPQVVGHCHPLFVKPSLAAARHFRYQPKVVNGQAVAVANVKNTFTYRIQ